MADPYRRNGAPADRAGSIPGSSFPGYLSTDSSLSAAHINDLHGSSSDYPPKNILPVRSGALGFNDITDFGVPPQPLIGGITSAGNFGGYPTTLEDSNFIGQRRDVAHGVSPGITDIGRPTSFLRKTESLPPAMRESNILFVDGLPKDCTRREVGHLFRPFIGFKEIRVVHKEPRRSGDKAMVLCFVAYSDARCSRTALEALQGYKFDDKKPDSPTLRIQFAHFPFGLPSVIPRKPTI